MIGYVLVALLVTAQTPASDADRRQAFTHYRAGQELLAGEQWENAAEAFQQAIKYDRLFTDAHYGLGQAYMGLQRYASAAQAFDACIEAARDIHALRERDRVKGEREIDDEIRELRETIRQMAGQVGRDLRRSQLE